MDIYPPIQNKYYRWYYNIIYNGKKRGLKKDLLNYHVEKHHIIPDCFYINSSRKSKTGWLDGNPNIPKNLVFHLISF